MTGLRYSPLHVTEFRGEMLGKFKVGLARLKSIYFSVELSLREISCYECARAWPRAHLRLRFQHLFFTFIQVIVGCWKINKQIITPSQSTLILRRDHLRSTSGIISSSGSFAVQYSSWGSFVALYSDLTFVWVNNTVEIVEGQSSLFPRNNYTQNRNRNRTWKVSSTQDMANTCS